MIAYTAKKYYGIKMSASESFPNQEPTPEHLALVDQRLEELLLFVDTVTYSRAIASVDEVPGGYGEVSIILSERLGTRLSQEIRLFLPFGDGEQTDYVSAALRKDSEGYYLVTFPPDFTGNQLDLLRPLADSADKESAALVQFAAFLSGEIAKQGTPSFLYNLPIRDESFDTIWQNLTGLMDMAEAPRDYDFSFKGQLDGKKVVVFAQGYPPTTDGVRLPETEMDLKATYVSIENDFTYTRKVMEGKVVQSEYEEEISLNDLPELTDDERSRHPYVVLPINFGSAPSNEDLYQAGEEIRAFLPAAGYKVIMALDGGSLEAAATFFVETEAEGQKVADNLYRRELAEARKSKEITSARITHVAEVLAQIVANERNKIFFS